MFFILQNEPVGRDPVQNAIIQDVLAHNKYSHSYEYVSIMDFYKDDTDEDLFSMKKVLKTPEDFDERYREAIPIGTVRFVETYLRMFKGIERDNAIEIPPIFKNRWTMSCGTILSRQNLLIFRSIACENYYI